MVEPGSKKHNAVPKADALGALCYGGHTPPPLGHLQLVDDAKLLAPSSLASATRSRYASQLAGDAPLARSVGGNGGRPYSSQGENGLRLGIHILWGADVLVERASKTLKNIVGVDVLHSTAVVKDGQIAEYRVDLKVAFVVEDQS